jgi:HlyD family secretion protein
MPRLPLALPAADWRSLEETAPARPPLAARATLYAVLALCASAVLWAALAHVDRVVVGKGKLVTTAATIVVQPLETSVVRSIDARIGEFVAAGTKLATLDPTFSEADVGQLEERHRSLAAQIARLEAELANTRYAPGNDAEGRLQSAIFETRRSNYAAKLDAFDQQVARAEAGIATKRADQRAIAARLAVARELESMRNVLHEKEIGSKINLLEARGNRLELERAMALAGNEAEELARDVAKTRADRESFTEEWRQKTAEELVTARRDDDTAVKQLEKARRRNAMVVLTAPADAIVLDVAQRSAGSVVREAEPLFTLVPADVPLEAEVMVDAKDIASVEAGAETRVKLDAYPFQKHGTLAGRLRTVSQDSFSDKEKEVARGAAFYRARVALDATTLRDVGPEFRLIPGMTVSAEIKAGERTVLSYFLYPLLRGLDESIREP